MGVTGEFESQNEASIFSFVVVGGGIAGVSCIEQILEIEPEAKILLVTSSPAVKEVTSVKKLTKTLEDFVVVEKTLKSFKEVHESVKIVEDEVTELKFDEKIVKTRINGPFRYKKLCLCCGARPNVLFQETEYVVGIRDTESVQDLAARISGARRFVILGNGGIATELVYELKGVHIVWVVKDSNISAHYFDAGAAEFFMDAKIRRGESSKSDQTKLRKTTKYVLHSSAQSDKPGLHKPSGSALGPDWHEGYLLSGAAADKHVDVKYKAEIAELIPAEKYQSKEEENWPVYAKLTTGEVVGCDLVISATGVHPNISWIPIKCDPVKGIPVNCRMETEIKDVFAAGDVCWANWDLSPKWFQMKLWTQARHMGLVAGKYMHKSLQNDVSGASYDATDDEPEFFFEIFSHVTRFFGFKVVLLGLYNAQGLEPGSYEYLIRCTKNVEYIKVVLRNSRMQGAILVGDTGLEETFENLIINQLDLSSYGEDLLNPDIDIEDYFD